MQRRNTGSGANYPLITNLQKMDNRNLMKQAIFNDTQIYGANQLYLLTKVRYLGSVFLFHVHFHY